MRSQAVKLYLFSSLAIITLTLVWGFRSIPKQASLSEATIRASAEDELLVLSGATQAAVEALRYRLLDVLKAEGNEHSTRTFQTSPFVAATLLEWDQTQWKFLWHSSKIKSQFQSADLKTWMMEWPLAKLASDETHFVKVGDWQGQPYFAMIAPVRKPNNIPMIGIGIFPANQFGLQLPADRAREVKVFDSKGFALALAKPAYLGASVKKENVVEDMLEGDETFLRRDGKTPKGLAQYELATRVARTNLFIANIAGLQPPRPYKLMSWIYLFLTALGASALNWHLFRTWSQQNLELLSQKELAIENLKKALENSTHTDDVKVLVEDVPPGPIGTSSTKNLEFVEEEALPPAPELLKSATLETVVRAALRSYRDKIEEYGIQVAEKGLGSIPVTTDALQLQTAIEEVIKNGVEAMQFSKERWLTLTGIRHKDRVVLTVEDTGVGVPTENRDKVFDPFFSTKDSQGVARGLGLNVTRRVIEELKGLVTLESHQGETSSGTTVRMEWELPEDKVEISESSAPVELAPSDLNKVPVISELDLLAEAYQVPVRKPIVRTMD